MNYIKKILFFSILFVSLLNLHANDQENIPLLKQLYKAFPATGGLNDQLISEQKKVILDKYFDKQLSSLIARDNLCKQRTQEICKLDFDPIYASQDPEIKNITYVVDKDYVDVYLFYVGIKKPIKVIYSFNKETNKINNILYQDGTSLQNILK
ncbi:MAG: hypothetical protein NT103_00420 [Campylobacterales bacterium]|nr:hypothetical protein [Campylobacterales bacterium]